MTTVLILAAICVVGAFIGDTFVGGYVVDKQRLDDEDEDCDDEDEETGSPYRTPMYVECEDGTVEEVVIEDKPKRSVVGTKALEIKALTSAIKRLEASTLENARGGFMASYEADLARLRHYSSELERLLNT